MKKLIFLLPFLISCAGSPNIKVNKNISVIINGIAEEEGKMLTELPYPIFINIYYNTESTTKSDADISQEGDLQMVSYQSC